MPPIIGNIIVIAILAVVAFFSGRAVLRNIRAQLRGEAACAGCSGNCQGCSMAKAGAPAQCSACSISAKEIEEIKRSLKTD